MATAADRPAPSARRASSSDLDGIGRSLARAFDGDPVWNYLVGRRRGDFVARATAYFRSEAVTHLQLSSLWTADGTPGAALWSPPGHWKTGTRELLRVLVPALRLFGLRSPNAVATLSLIERHHPTEPHWYLAVLGTDPDQQGHGIGSALLAPVLQRCDDEGIGAYLESSKERNLAFYSRHGFEADEPIHLRNGPPVWPMWRDPRPPEAS